MSFWPRLRRRSTRGRKRTTTNANPYASRDNKYAALTAELQAQRAQFAAEKGVPVSVVRFISRSSRGWVYLPPDSPESPDSPDSPSSSAAHSPIPSHDDEVTSSPFQEFALPPPALPLPPTMQSSARIGNGEGSVGQSGEESFYCPLRSAGRLVLSRKMKDKAWVQISKTAAVLFVKVLVFSRALGASTAFAFTFAVVVNTLNRGKATFQRMFTALVTQLLTTLKPYLSLLQEGKSSLTPIRPAAAKPAPPQSSAPGPAASTQQFSVSSEMKFSPITETSNGLGSRSSSFAFPVLTRDSSSRLTSARFPNQREKDTSTKVESTKSTVPVVSPLVENNKLPSTRSCQKLKSKLFKSSPARKGKNSTPSSSSGESSADSADSTGASDLSSTASTRRGKTSKKKSSFISRKASRCTENECSNEVERPASKSSKKVTKSHELFFRSLTGNRGKESTTTSKDVSAPSDPPAGVKNLSRSQELKCVFKSFGRKKGCRSQELTSISPPSIQDLELPPSTVESLQALAFPFREEKQVQKQKRSFSTCSSRQLSPQRGNSLEKTTSDSSDEKASSSKAIDAGTPHSPRASAAYVTNKGVVKSSTASTSSTSASSSKFCGIASAAELKPGLRRVRTTVPMSHPSDHPSDYQVSELNKIKSSVSRSPPLPTQVGELGRSVVLSREILGSLLLLAILALLLLGRLPAILGTSCFCLILSNCQRFFSKNLTQRDKELIKRSSGISRLHPASSNAANRQTTTSTPVHDKAGLQSSEYRKRVLIEGLLDRGNRR